MPKKKAGTLTARQKKFIEAYMDGHTPTESAIIAGYSKNSARQRAGETMKVPEVAEAIRAHESALAAEIQRKFATDARKAAKTVLEIMLDPDAPRRDRLNAAKDILDRGGYTGESVVRLMGDASAPVSVEFRGELDKWSK